MNTYTALVQDVYPTKAWLLDTISSPFDFLLWCKWTRVFNIFSVLRPGMKNYLVATQNKMNSPHRHQQYCLKSFEVKANNIDVRIYFTLWPPYWYLTRSQPSLSLVLSAAEQNARGSHHPLRRVFPSPHDSRLSPKRIKDDWGRVRRRASTWWLYTECCNIWLLKTLQSYNLDKMFPSPTL